MTVLATRSPLAIARSYLALTKPRVIELLLITTVPPMVLAAKGWPSTALVLATLVGGAMAAGSANTINCYVDRDIDALMRRTRRRPLVKDAQVTPVAALRFGIVLGALSTVWLGLLVNWPSAMLADAAILFYVFVYTLGLKRRTPNNIVIGGAAGCFPAVIGWSAVTGTVGWPAMVLFLVVFLWTPPHFWALAMRYRDDYAAANIPMLPVLVDDETVVRKIVLYSYGMIAATLALTPAVGWLYGVIAAALGAVFLHQVYQLLGEIRAGQEARPMRLFHLSNAYLTALFVTVAVVPLLPL